MAHGTFAWRPLGVLACIVATWKDCTAKPRKDLHINFKSQDMH
jgi:hypothetical protein